VPLEGQEPQAPSIGEAGQELRAGHIPPDREDTGSSARTDSAADGPPVGQQAESTFPALMTEYVVVRLVLSLPRSKLTELIIEFSPHAHFVDAQILRGDGWDRLNSQ
jgi:hypothetical protein